MNTCNMKKNSLSAVMMVVLGAAFFSIVCLIGYSLGESKSGESKSGESKSVERYPEYPICDVIGNRRSERAMSGEPITKDQLNQLFEAARWAPSSFNAQPWRFVYAFRGTENWESFLGLLNPSNQIWAKNAAVLVAIVSKNNSERGMPLGSHSFDTGAAWENLALQATSMNLVTCAIGGFDRKEASKLLDISDAFTIETMCAIGHPGEKYQLPIRLQERQMKVDRKPIESFVFEGKMS